MTTSCATGRSRRYFYYRCVSGGKGRGCPMRPINAEELDKAVLRMVLDVARHPNLVKAALAGSREQETAGIRRLKSHLHHAQKGRDEARDRVTALMDMAGRRLVNEANAPQWNADLAEWTRKRDKTDAQVTALADELAAIAERQTNAVDIEEAMRVVAASIESGNPDLQRQYLRVLLKRVTLHDDRMDLDIYLLDQPLDGGPPPSGGSPSIGGGSPERTSRQPGLSSPRTVTVACPFARRRARQVVLASCGSKMKRPLYVLLRAKE